MGTTLHAADYYLAMRFSVIHLSIRLGPVGRRPSSRMLIRVFSGGEPLLPDYRASPAWVIRWQTLHGAVRRRPVVRAEGAVSPETNGSHGPPSRWSCTGSLCARNAVARFTRRCASFSVANGVSLDDRRALPCGLLGPVGTPEYSLRRLGVWTVHARHQTRRKMC